MSRYTGKAVVQDGTVADRSTHLEEILRLFQEQLAGKEKALVLVPLEDKARIRQQIGELRQEIAEVEGELQQLGNKAVVSPGGGKATGATQAVMDNSTGYQANQTQGPVVQGEGNSVVVNYYGGGSAAQPQGPMAGKAAETAGEGSRSTSRAQQLRHDRLRRELQQLEEEYQAVSDQVAVTIDPTTRIRLQRQLEQLEQNMESIDANLNASF